MGAPAKTKRCNHISHRVMGLSVSYAICQSKLFQAENRAPLGAIGNRQAGWRERCGRHDEAQNIRAAVTVVAREIGWLKRLEKRVPEHLLVESDRKSTRLNSSH